MTSDRLLSALSHHATPCYYYDMDVLNQSLEQVQMHGMQKGYHVHFALKANHEPKILQHIQKAGLGADCVSGGEVQQALDYGFSPSKIAFAGVGKTDEEMILGLENDLFCFNVESYEELVVLNNLAQKMGEKARVALRLNPNVAVQTHKYITTGLHENKFGISDDELVEVLNYLPDAEAVDFLGVHFHIGSQITELTPFEQLCKKCNEYVRFIESKGFQVRVLNMGGGFGVDYENPDQAPYPDFKSFFEVFDRHLEVREHQEVHFELGRSIIAQAGSLITKVLYIKERTHKNFAVVDAGMTELIRPALYQAVHHIDKLTSDQNSKTSKKINVYDVVGPICESSDTFRVGIELEELERGDTLAIRSAGAYGQVMKSRYNLRPDHPTLYSDEL